MSLQRKWQSAPLALRALARVIQRMTWPVPMVKEASVLKTMEVIALLFLEKYQGFSKSHQLRLSKIGNSFCQRKP
jgi:hypothetical protein